ncbi:MAG: hypothetical protein Q9227_006831 [Pyrenula ochraceoflavens]
MHQQNTSSSGFQPQNDDEPLLTQRADSENDDLRSVIDDLTIENRRLKQRLRNYRAKKSAGTEEDRLFEVRIHGLPAEKRMELEEILRSFTSGLTSANHSAAAPSYYKESSRNVSEKNLGTLASLQAPQKGSNTESAYTSTSNAYSSVKPPRLNPSDSAYASMSNTGGQSSSGPTSNTSRRETRTARRITDKNIKSYLRDIPENLLPKQSPIMSDRTKMKLVVERLEQLFTGKRAAPGPHSQPLQQQEISQSAASADKAQAIRDNKSVPDEGRREARILPIDDYAEKSTDDKYEINHRQTHQRLENIATSVQGFDQRPTRPLDLDLHRAQDATENMQYIRHLGLSSPLVVSEDDRPSRWLYLNLLISMAQLHMMNVTPEFIRKAVSSISTKLELSKDGRKLRWRGGEEGTMFSSDSGSNAGVSTGTSPDGNAQVQKKSRSSGMQNSNAASSTEAISSSIQPGPTNMGSSTQTGQWSGTAPMTVNAKAPNKFEYKPLFIKQNSTDSEESAEQENVSADYLDRPDATTMADSSLNTSKVYGRSKSSSQKHAQEGPIIFYNHSVFYTDLSGDRKFLHKPNYPRTKSDRPILGARSTSPGYSDDVRDSNILSTAARASPSEDIPMSDVPNTDLPPLTSDRKSDRPAKELHVSGVGGVLPDDNFMLDVRVGHDGRHPPRPRSGVKPDGQVRHKVLSTQRVNLLPSPLPPPSYFFGFSSSSSSANPIGQDDASEASFDDDADDENLLTNSHEDLDSSRAAPPVFAPSALMATDSGSGRTHSSMVENDDDDLDSLSANTDSFSEDDGENAEIDLLEHARRACPEEIAAQERAFESANLGRLNGDLPAGSSAATAGGAGSGMPSVSDKASPGPDDSFLDRASVRPVGSLKRGWSGMESEDWGSDSGLGSNGYGSGPAEKARKVDLSD